MATLLLGAVGTVLGGPIGGAIGALAGRQVDNLVFGSSRVKGPRLKDLEVTTSSYGSAIPRHFGRMRVPGTIIWATDLVEHADTSGSKQGPSITTYTYSISMAVALSSRPIQAIGRIWADGKLLRGEDGLLKVGGAMRVHDGHADQAPDPLILSAEGAQRCAAHRGLAYVVFEDLDLAEFYNRIPSLTFEVVADDAFDLAGAMSEIVAGSDVTIDETAIAGWTCETSAADTLELLTPLWPLDVDTGGGRIVIRAVDDAQTVLSLPEPAIPVDDGEFGARSGFVRRRASSEAVLPEALRYYDLDRDYLPGVQRAAVRTRPGNPVTLDLPAAMEAGAAKAIIERTGHRIDWSRDRITWRIAELMPEVGPGRAVSLPGVPGTWRIESWEWREGGVELSLSRRVPLAASDALAGPADPGRATVQPDLPPGETRLAAFELPFDGSGSADTPQTFAAVSSPARHWSGAALYAEEGDGELRPLGPSGRTRSVIGTSETVLRPAAPTVFDRGSSLLVRLVAPDLQLTSASLRDLSLGANLALAGSEIIQFARAESLGEGLWRLSGFLRGRAGTEAAILSHDVGEGFVLLDRRPRVLDATVLGTRPDIRVVAVGIADPEPVIAPVLLRGIARRPLSPVHGRATLLEDGRLRLEWTRRARGAWTWQDSLDVPLREELESYAVSFGPPESPAASWTVGENRLEINAARLADLAALAPGGGFEVRQIGTGALSLPLSLGPLPAT
ncbi:hypothetical protein B2G71_00410 [Novosphingobium sp. PC22D]|uniref:GTA baseplate fiber-binding domain-containing protein n=1 Tax=Novosphingobium sp. PC22D TaxID=1962403 RepID=UPI000BF23529|nr:phage tail protein [Novosphingobium sp. PC22D]PEQ14121.1 hypothetical protein B2G71_00410 [Novosphingobium sp. PC22D]